eukprot:CAMPEP_0172681740 /NCGR_PEP_ID=MMETSP1074-20121228/17676_1 /TAXON_ID=2916 /ORGANISM="Ceratium fusus, Strain PA161109" /LENGTH=110 /DNA_ID=CAMNT_0013500295 /DNA_START=152 /DNA_END=484 /DNA_ORIENTATION=-
MASFAATFHVIDAINQRLHSLPRHPLARAQCLELSAPASYLSEWFPWFRSDRVPASPALSRTWAGRQAERPEGAMAAPKSASLGRKFRRNRNKPLRLDWLASFANLIIGL